MAKSGLEDKNGVVHIDGLENTPHAIGFCAPLGARVRRDTRCRYALTAYTHVQRPITCVECLARV